MAHEDPVIDLNTGNVPDIAELAEEVHRTNRLAVIRRGTEDIAVIAPVKKATKRRALPKKSPEDMEAFWSSFGSWKDMDTEQIKAANAESRRISTKPRPALGAV
jgi:hypothetical protein